MGGAEKYVSAACHLHHHSLIQRTQNWSVCVRAYFWYGSPDQYLLPCFGRIKLSIHFYLCLGIRTPVKYKYLLSGCITNISWRFLCCGVVLLDGKTEETIALSKPYNHVIVGGDADVSFSTCAVSFVHENSNGERERFMDIYFLKKNCASSSKALR